MARKEADRSQPAHGLHDVFGVVLLFVALFFLVALFTYDSADSAANTTAPNAITHNLAGGVGAFFALKLFRILGAAAFVVPLLLILYGLGHLFQFLAYVRRRWPWGLVLLVCLMGLLSMYEANLSWLRALSNHLNAPSVGGYIGSFFYKGILIHFGKVGATILLGAAYLVCLLYLTNFHLGEWCRAWWAGSPAKGATPKDAELERRARDLGKEAKRLQDELDKTGNKEPTPQGLGQDLKPVPAPTVRDLSVSQSKPGTDKKSGAVEAANADASKDGAPVEPVKSRASKAPKDIGPATTKDILGTKSEPVSARVDEPPETGSAKPVDATEEVIPAETVAAAAGQTPAAASEVAVAGTTPSSPSPKPRAASRKPKPLAVASAPMIGNYQLPPLDFLQYPEPPTKPTESKEELMANARLMQQTLAQFDIEVSLGDITKGPTITRYELHPAPGVKLEKISALNNNIAAALKAERINILAPIPGKSSVGVEVPNATKTKVIMRDLFESDEWRNTKARVPLALGKDVYGQPIVADLAEMPHLLIAGSTGSGKSVCINAIISSLLYRFPPDQLRFVMIDPKVVELQHYNTLPHLVVPVVTDPKKVILALRWVINEMEKRYQIFARVGVRNIRSFNDRPKHKPLPKSEPELPLMARKEKIETSQEGFAVELDEEIVVPRDEDIVIPDRLSYIVVIIDELADLMLVAPADVEMAIARITQMARAAGIHCIVATQRPSVDVITGVIKANIPARIAFQVAAKVDSRTILDAMGADKLLGKGDMLYLPPGSAKLIRAQGALVTDQEIQSVVDFIAKQGKPSYEVDIHQQLSQPASGSDGDSGGSGEDEDLIQQCIEVIRSEQKASVSLLQRRLRLGYTRAARIMDELEDRGIVGPNKGAEPRDILIDLDVGEPAAESQPGASEQ